jgi:hypothetical protein
MYQPNGWAGPAAALCLEQIAASVNEPRYVSIVTKSVVVLVSPLAIDNKKA